MIETTIPVEGMNNEDKLQTLEDALTSIEGVERALIDVEEKEIYIQFDEGVTNLDLIKEIIHNMGLQCV